MVSVKIEDLTKTFGEVTAVNDLNINVRDKEFVALLGPSGCGKSTILRCIAGLETPDKGKIYFGSKVVNDVAPSDRNIAMVFQNYALYPNKTVYENIEFPLKMGGGVDEEERDRKVRKTAELLQVSELLDRKPGELSGGQAQRAALGRSIVRSPSVFLLDEPLSNLDAKLREQMRVELKELQEKLKVTTIYVTHDQKEAMTMADRIVLLRGGKMQQCGIPKELYTRPVNIFTAGFMGAPRMNLIECSLVKRNESMYLDAEKFEFKLNKDTELDKDTAKTVEENKGGFEVVFGIRPEHISIHPSRKGRDSREAKVIALEYLGADTIVDVRMGGENELKIRTPQLASSVKPGTKIWLTFNEDKIHIYDKKTGASLIKGV